MDLVSLCSNAKNAKKDIILLDENARNQALISVADSIVENADYILMENAKDISAAISNNMSSGLVDRLRLSKDRIIAMAQGTKEVALLPDPLGNVLETFNRPNGLVIEKCSVPLGVIGIIYESRPNVTLDAFALTFKAGNVVVLKGGSDAINSNKAITKVIRDALEKNNINPDVIGLITSTDRETTTQFMKMNDYIDVIIPRGSAGLIKAVVENSSIPVIETGSGNCHIYLDKTCDVEKAVNICLNAKTQRIGVCNACESLVVHKDVVDTVLVKVCEALKDKNVEIRGDESARLVLDCNEATEEDFYTEYLDYKISVKTVNNIDEAITHINKHSTGHSECIITEDTENAERFLNEIDSACVYVNASTRFTDGFEFGFGAEIGISTQHLHARGPMGLRELTTYKYKIRGNGQIRG